MSLNSHIREGSKSPIGRFFLERFSQMSNITKRVNHQLRSATTFRPTGSIPSYIYGTLGAALDYRLRYYFAVSRSEELIAWTGAWSLALKPLENDNDIPLTDKDWDDLSHVLGLSWADVPQAQGSYSPGLLRSFFWNLDRTLARIEPCGRRLGHKDERLLARYCYVLALFEQVWRLELGPIDSAGPLFQPSPKTTMKELMGIPEVEWLEDLCAMSWLFYDNCKHLLSQTAVLNLNPTFAGSADIGGADADLIVDGCLIEVKASIKPMLKPEYLRQLLGYLLLDYDDSYQVTALAVYMARQGILLRWPVEELLYKLTGDPTASVAVLRQEFRTLFSEGQTMPPHLDAHKQAQRVQTTPQQQMMDLVELSSDETR